MINNLFLPRISIITHRQEKNEKWSHMIGETCESMYITTKICCVYGTALDNIDELLCSSIVFWVVGFDDVFPEEINVIYQRNHEVVQILISDNLEHAKIGYEYRVFRVVSRADFKNDIAECMQAIKTLLLSNQEIIRLKSVRRSVFLMPKSIMYFQGTGGRRVLAYGVDGGLLPIEVNESLDHCEKHLVNSSFLRIHRKYLINMYHVQKVLNYKVHFIGGTILYVAQKRYSEVCNRYDEWIKCQTYIVK